MNTLKVALTAAIVMTGASCAGAQHTARALPELSACRGLSDLDQRVAQVYDVARVRRVSPIYRKHFLARAIQPRYLHGAELYVDAEAGVSQPYMQRVLSCYAEARSGGHPNDPLSAEHVESVNVRTQGSHYVIAVTSSDRHAAKQIWQRARGLVQPRSHVEVQQLSEGASHSAEL